MNQLVLESIFLVFAFINLCITVFLLWQAKQRRVFGKALLGVFSGVGVAISMSIGGMVIVLISQFFIGSEFVNVELMGVFMVAVCAIPVATWAAGKV